MAASATASASAASFLWRLTNGFTALVAGEGRTIVINDALDHPLFVGNEAPHWRVHAIAGMPLKHAAKQG